MIQRPSDTATVVSTWRTSSPVKPIFGVEPNGKTFSIMAIDIHTMRAGKIARTDYVGNWVAAVGQLSGK